MKTKMNNQGMHSHRFRDNPEEKRIAESWERMNETGALLDHLIDPRTDNLTGRAPTASDNDRKVAATVIQWLGSPVGQAWLRDLGYERGDK